MPSVSEPFGISALEAMSYETPVILSRQSGASEVLRHALKIDFWDVQKLAAQIVAVLTYPELRSSIVDMARQEVRRVHWEAAAQKVRLVYEKVAREKPAHALAHAHAHHQGRRS
jgi:glycogen synthase